MSDIDLLKQRGGVAGWVLVAALGVQACVGVAAQAQTNGARPQGVAGSRLAGQSFAAQGVDRLPQPMPGKPVDIAAIARGFDATGAAAVAQALGKGPQLLVFVSFTMPEGALRRLVAQAERVSAVLVLRGLKDGSMVKTAVAVRELIGNHKPMIQIDPQGFDRFSVQQVPTFVLLKDGAQLQRCNDTSCPTPATYVDVAGDVSIDYALEWIGSRSAMYKREAQLLLQRLRE